MGSVTDGFVHGRFQPFHNGHLVLPAAMADPRLAYSGIP